MTTTLAIFFISLVFALALTPLAGRFGVRFGAVDVPGERKVHSSSIPRCGGLAIFAAFSLTLIISTFFMTSVSDLLVMNRETTFLLLGRLWFSAWGFLMISIVLVTR